MVVELLEVARPVKGPVNIAVMPSPGEVDLYVRDLFMYMD
jgi:hypothetical protein